MLRSFLFGSISMVGCMFRRGLLMIWFSAAFTAFLVVTVVGLGFWFLPHMFTPPPREPDFTDVDELANQ